MDATIGKKWVEALRSGKYKQGRGHLRANDRFCCLGVLCDLVAPQWWDQEDDTHAGTGLVPHSDVLDLAGMEGDRYSSYMRALTEMNDEEEKSFAEIADYIEQNMEAL